MEIDRIALALIFKKLQPNKVVVLLGARRVGKTKLIEKIVSFSNFCFTLIFRKG